MLMTGGSALTLRGGQRRRAEEDRLFGRQQHVSLHKIKVKKNENTASLWDSSTVTALGDKND